MSAPLATRGAALFWGKKPSLLSSLLDLSSVVHGDYVVIRSPSPVTIVFDKGPYALSIGPWEAPVPAELVRKEAITPPKTRPRAKVRISDIRSILDYILDRLSLIDIKDYGDLVLRTAKLGAGEELILKAETYASPPPIIKAIYRGTTGPNRDISISSRLELDVDHDKLMPRTLEFTVSRMGNPVLEYRAEAKDNYVGNSVEMPDTVIEMKGGKVELDEPIPTPPGLEESVVRIQVARPTDLPTVAEELEAPRRSSTHLASSSYKAYPLIQPPWIPEMESAPTVIQATEGMRLPTRGAEAALYDITATIEVRDPASLIDEIFNLRDTYYPRAYILSKGRAKSIYERDISVLEPRAPEGEITFSPSEALDRLEELAEELSQAGLRVDIDKNTSLSARAGDTLLQISRHHASPIDLEKLYLEAASPGEEEPVFTLSLQREPREQKRYRVIVIAPRRAVEPLSSILAAYGLQLL